MRLLYIVRVTSVDTIHIFPSWYLWNLLSYSLPSLHATLQRGFPHPLVLQAPWITFMVIFICRSSLSRPQNDADAGKDTWPVLPTWDNITIPGMARL